MDAQDSLSEYKLTPSQKAVAEAQAEYMVARMISAAQNREVVGAIADTWAEHFYRIVGKAVMRMGLYLLILLIAIGSYKFGLLDAFLDKVRR